VLIGQGRLDRAREQYRIIERYLQTQLGIGPSAETIALRDELNSFGF
jgi:hypothetical protein